MSGDRASAVAESSVVAGSIPSIAGLLDLWAASTGDPRVAIAVLDGPVDRTHPALVGANLTTVEVAAPVMSQPGGAATWHGTLVASLIFGRHGRSPVAGIAPHCRGIIVPVFSDFVDRAAIDPESGRPFRPACSQLDLARAILLAAEYGAQVINVSGGQYVPTGAAQPILADAVGRCVRRGILIVAAAGNDGCECLHMPAALPGVLAVGAMDARGEPLEMSNWGQSYRTGGLLALGAGLLGATPGGRTSVVSGTSFATAVVSGVAGLLWSLALPGGRRTDGARIRSLLLDSAEKCVNDSHSCRRWLAGRLDLVKAGSMLRKVRESGEILLDSPEKRLDDLSLSRRRLAGRLNLAKAGCLLRNEDPSMSDEMVAPSSSAELSSPNCDVAIEPRVNDGRDSTTEWARTVPPASSVAPSEGCGCATCRAKAGAGSRGLVFALGQLGYDLVSEARRDSIQQHMDRDKSNPLEPAQMLGYLKTHDWEAASILWTLSSDQVPLYAVAPAGPFAAKGYELLREFLADQLSGQVEMVSIPGRLAGQARLWNGQVVPVVTPEPRGMYSWTIGALVQSVVGKPPPASAAPEQHAAHGRKAQGVRGFLQKVYHELRNLGLTAEERAINHAATNAYQIGQVFEPALKESMELDAIDVERSPICRPDSDCWDVKIHFFYPERQVQTVRRVFRFTVDVSDVVPVTVGPMRSWFVR
ncbi:MAG: PatA/PatG family cyanobactin maturation protease [Isosphaerales bacterium]